MILHTQNKYSGGKSNLRSMLLVGVKKQTSNKHITTGHNFEPSHFTSQENIWVVLSGETY